MKGQIGGNVKNCVWAERKRGKRAEDRRIVSAVFYIKKKDPPFPVPPPALFAAMIRFCPLALAFFKRAGKTDGEGMRLFAVFL